MSDSVVKRIHEAAIQFFTSLNGDIYTCQTGLYKTVFIQELSR